MKAEKWYWFTFADGYQVCARGMSSQERGWRRVSTESWSRRRLRKED